MFCHSFVSRSAGPGCRDPLGLICCLLLASDSPLLKPRLGELQGGGGRGQGRGGAGGSRGRGGSGTQRRQSQQEPDEHGNLDQEGNRVSTSPGLEPEEDCECEDSRDSSADLEDPTVAGIDKLLQQDAAIEEACLQDKLNMALLADFHNAARCGVWSQ